MSEKTHKDYIDSAVNFLSFKMDQPYHSKYKHIMEAYGDLREYRINRGRKSFFLPFTDTIADMNLNDRLHKLSFTKKITSKEKEILMEWDSKYNPKNIKTPPLEGSFAQFLEEKKKEGWTD